jgi:hypothetical protein
MFEKLVHAIILEGSDELSGNEALALANQIETSIYWGDADIAAAAKSVVSEELAAREAFEL